MLGTLTLTLPSFSFQQSHHRRMSLRAAMAEVAHPAAAAAADRRSLYEVLRVRQNASQVEIKTAYRTLAKLYHPDATSRFMDSSIAATSDGRDFIEIQNAYETLSDPDARAVYDSNLNVNSTRRWNTAGISGYGSPSRSRFYRTRRWETDQCW
ncbi:Chaperone protein DnaJ [Sesamum alatum]|uniref:Chaperone protein DnaJ n=1 Tax=Sesamum alatum TaxID=300844 RepID=A0AAE1Z1F9_9LAMI|nr:Chaperone protein DnaJ [Sesamum alatum]